MLRRFSSRRASLYREFLKPCLAGATRYDRIAGYFQSSLLELASESLASIPHIRIVCNTEVSAEDVKTVRIATGARRKELEEGLLRLAWNAGHFPHLVDVHGARAQQRLNVLHDLLMASGKDGHPSEEADTLRRGDELEVRRLGWAIQLRAVETLARDLRQNDWNEERTKFYQFAHSDTVLPHTEKQRLLDLALVTGTGTEAIAVFGRRVAVWDASPAHALALRVAVSSLSIDEQQEIFISVESYLVRRAVCGLSRKGYNKVFAQQLKRLMENELSAASFRAALSSSSGDASRWPTNEEFRRQWLDGAVFPGRLDTAKLRSVFHRLETAMRSELTEERVPLSKEALDIDHIMPQSWYSHWPLPGGSTVSMDEAIAAAPLKYVGEGLEPKTQAIHRRQDAVPRIGNLTLVHYGVNRSLQNQAFDAKRKAMFDHSNLQLNRRLMQLESWDEAAILERGEELAKIAMRIRPGPV